MLQTVFSSYGSHCLQRLSADNKSSQARKELNNETISGFNNCTAVQDFVTCRR